MGGSENPLELREFHGALGRVGCILKMYIPGIHKCAWVCVRAQLLIHV